MSSKGKIDHYNNKRIKLEDNHKNLASFGATCRNSVSNRFKKKLMKSFKKQLDDNCVQTYNTFTNTDEKDVKEHEIILAFKINKFLLKEETSAKIYQLIKNKIALDNVFSIHSLAKLHQIATVSDLSLGYIERCFPIVVETKNFLHLGFDMVAKILSSSELNIHSEVEIFKAAIFWMKHNSKERSKYAKQLLLKVRIPLLSEHALKYILDEVSLLSKTNDGVNMYKTFLVKKSFSSKNMSNIYYTNRYCNQSKYNLLILGGCDKKMNKLVSKVVKIDGSDTNNVKDLRSMYSGRKCFEAVCLKGEVYVFGGSDRYSYKMHFVRSVAKYSPLNNDWTVVTDMVAKCENFCACSFTNKIFFFGSEYYDDLLNEYLITSSCLQFDPKNKNWSEIANMNVARSHAACAVYQGNILVSGGSPDIYNDLKTVESYDVFANKWSLMPSMIKGKSDHCLVVVKDKLFAIGQEPGSCELFDNVCEKFVLLNHQPSINCNKILSIGRKIVVFQECRSSIICYDVDKDKWSEESCEVTKHIRDFSCVKLPCY